MTKFFYFGFGVINLSNILHVQKKVDNNLNVKGIKVTFINGETLSEKCDEETANDVFKQLIETNKEQK